MYQGSTEKTGAIPWPNLKAAHRVLLWYCAKKKGRSCSRAQYYCICLACQQNFIVCEKAASLTQSCTKPPSEVHRQVSVSGASVSFCLHLFLNLRKISPKECHSRLLHHHQWHFYCRKNTTNHRFTRLLAAKVVSENILHFGDEYISPMVWESTLTSWLASLRSIGHVAGA